MTLPRKFREDRYEEYCNFLQLWWKYTPVWWYTFAPAMHTFLKNTDLSGKTVYPFATNGGWIGHTFEDFAKACPDASVKAGLNVRFNEADQITSDAEVEQWIGRIS